jgi:hypothetical protein
VNAETPVLVLKLVSHGGIGVVRTLGRLGVPVYAVNSDASAPAAAMRLIVKGSTAEIWSSSAGGTFQSRSTRGAATLAAVRAGTNALTTTISRIRPIVMTALVPE